jgi:hypothetical protein
MSNNENYGFGKFVPGFDFLQNLAKGASQTLPQMTNLSNWIAPTFSPEELEKRIGELKAVHFWLDQNSKALGATIQALEVQKMTLATLKGMNFNMGEVANALKLKATDTMFGGVQKAGQEAPDSAKGVSEAPKKSKSGRTSGKAAGPAVGVVDPLQWWGALTQQFQQIAASALKDAAAQTGVEAARNMASGVAREAMKTATGMAKAATTTMTARTPKRPAKRAAKKAAKR